MAFVGFRHAHIFALLEAAGRRADVEVVAACEEDAATREKLGDRVRITHTDFERMLAEVEFDLLAVGDYYGKRGQLIRRGLESGRHVISDKPICTRIEELECIEALARERHLAVGAMLDLREVPAMATLRQAVREGLIGTVVTATFFGQHPLLYRTRPAWYFEPGCHGGTLNDIGVHVVDATDWLLGRPISRIAAARAWNAGFPEVPHFQNAAQALMELEGGCGVFCDVSYLAPDRCGYTAPQYWRITCHGRGGMIEASAGAQTVLVATHDDTAPRLLPVAPPPQRSYLADFLADVEGRAGEAERTTARVLRTLRAALLLQQAADRQCRDVALAE